jgi:VCBS repeat-containing protein
VVGTYGTLTLNADGNYSYVADQNAADSLASGVTATDTFGYTIFDGIHTNTAALVITVTGINDNAPVAVDDTGVVDENATLSVAGVLANDTDADPSDPRNVSAVNGAALNVGAAVAGTYGTLTLNGDGSYSYVADQADALAAGVTVTDTFSYTVSDGLHADTADLVITVKGVNDAPVAGVPAKLTPIGVNSGAHLITQATLLVNATDVDGSPLTAIDLQIAKGAGTLVDNHDGTWTYTPKINDDTDVTFSFLVSDGVAAPVAASATLDIEPTQSSPEIGTPGDDSFTAVTGNSQYNAGAGVDTIAFNFRLVDAVVTWSGHQVIIDGPSSHTVLSGFEIYQFSDGTVNNNDGSPLIDDLFYNAQYHDVWNAQVDADFHYNATGWKEGRDPSAFFDTGFYLTLNPDVRAAGINPLTHYDTTGWKEGRLPSLEFGTQQYLEANPDVKAAQVDPLFHFLAVGASEGRQPIAPSALLAANGFDLVYYLRHNPDVAAAHVDPLQHFQTVGWKEGRDPNASFDTDGYLAAYADVRTAGVNPFDHYNQVGWHEGRDPSVNFDTGDYLAANPDVAAAGVNPLLHFLALGIYEGRSSHADGVWG